MKCIWFLVFFVIGMFIFRPNCFGLFVDNHMVTVANVTYPIPPKFDPKIREKIKNKECLAHAMFFEVRKNDSKEMIMIGNVVQNRIKSGRYPTKICDVVGRVDQFPWAAYGMDNRALNYLIKTSTVENKSWETAQTASDEVVSGKVPDLTGGAIAFHANTISKPKSDYWNKLKKTVTSRLHTFYAPHSSL